MSYPEYLYLLLGMGAVTYLPRMLPLVALAHRRLPQGVVDWLGYIPVAILSALVAPGLFSEGATRALVFGRLELLVALPTLFFAARTKSLGGTVMVGMGLYWLGKRVLLA